MQTWRALWTSTREWMCASTHKHTISRLGSETNYVSGQRVTYGRVPRSKAPLLRHWTFRLEERSLLHESALNARSLFDFTPTNLHSVESSFHWPHLLPGSSHHDHCTREETKKKVSKRKWSEREMRNSWALRYGEIRSNEIESEPEACRLSKMYH